MTDEENIINIGETINRPDLRQRQPDLAQQNLALKDRLGKFELLAHKQREKLEEAQAFVQKVLSPPHTLATLLNFNEEVAQVVMDNGQKFEVNYINELLENFEKGQRVYLNPQSLSIVKIKDKENHGYCAVIDDVLEDRVKITIDGRQRLIDKGNNGVNIGDTVIVDASLSMVLEGLGKQSKDYSVNKIEEVRWDMIGGLDYAVNDIMKIIEEPFLHKETYQRYGLSIPKGILLHGPPRCGKTMIAKAVAYSLQEKLRQESENPDLKGTFFSIKGPEFLSKWVGEGERMVRELFDRARQASYEHQGMPTIIFFDEAESSFKKRGSDMSAHYMDPLINTFLAEMDGMNGSDNLIWILATNRADLMDPAILGPGRIDKKIYIGRPDKKACQAIFEIYLKNVPLYNSHTIEQIAEHAASELFSDKRKIAQVDFVDGMKDFMHYRDIVSGALVKSVVDNAIRYAIERDIANGERGIKQEDLLRAIDEVIKADEKVLPSMILKDDIENKFGKRFQYIQGINPYSG